MPRKKNEKTEEVEEKEVKSISPLTRSYGSEDLNELRDKINELIAFNA